MGGRFSYSVYDYHRNYESTLLAYFFANPFWGERQVAILIIAWAHACLGMHYWLRQKPSYQRWKPVLLSFAVLLPTVALLGVAQGAREVHGLAQNPAWRAAMAAREHAGDPAYTAYIARLEFRIYWVYAGIIALVFLARGVRALVERRRGFVRIAYPSGETVRIPKGISVLEASRRAAVPHASICGGRGRCSTCRIRILRGADHLPLPAPHEVAVLARFHAARSVRLACQLCPLSDIAVLPLLPPDIGADDRRRRIAGAVDTERFVAIMFIDIRESTAMVEKRLPYDVIFLLNHFFEAVGGAIAAVGGTPNQFLGDGMMAIFGMDCDPKEACRRALAAADPVYHRLGDMNRTLADELPQPISIGIGIHAGSVILGEFGYRDRFLLTAIGDAVHVAARLQDLTKEYRCQAVVSEIVGETAGIALSGFASYEVGFRGRMAPMTVRVVKDVEEIAV